MTTEEKAKNVMSARYEFSFPAESLLVRLQKLTLCKNG